MGMFDTLISSYNLGPSFRVTQTKSLHNTMSTYWLSPGGELYLINYDGTQDFEYEQDDDAALWKGIKYVPNGTHGKVSPVDYYGILDIIPEKWTAHYAPYPRKRLYIDHGKLIKHEDSTPRN